MHLSLTSAWDAVSANVHVDTGCPLTTVHGVKVGARK